MLGVRKYSHTVISKSFRNSERKFFIFSRPQFISIVKGTLCRRDIQRNLCIAQTRNISKNRKLIGNTALTFPRLQSFSSTLKSNEKEEDKNHAFSGLERKRRNLLEGAGNLEHEEMTPKTPPSTFSIVNRLSDIARPEWNLIIGAAATLGVTSTVTLVIPYCSGLVIDLAIITNNGINSVHPQYTLSQLSLGLFGLTAIAGTGVFVRSILLTKAGNRIVERMRRNLFSATVAQEMAFFDSTQTGDLISRLSADTIIVQKAVTTEVINALRATVMSLGSSTLLFYTSPTLAVVSLCSLPPVFVAARLFGRRLRNMQKMVQTQLAEATDIAEEVYQGIRTVRQFAAEEHEIKRYSKVLQNAHDKAIDAGRSQAVFDGVVHVAANGAILGVLAVGGNMVASGDMTGGDLAGFLMYSLLMAGNISSLSSTYAEMLKAVAASERILSIIDRTPKIPPNYLIQESITNDVSEENLTPISTSNISSTCNPMEVNVAPLSVEFKNIHFAYPTRDNVPILEGLSFNVNPGEKIAICGSSGSGKSTIAYLLTRLYEASSANFIQNYDQYIKVGGTDVRSFQPKDLRESIGVVSQEPLLFAESIADNILYGRRTATDKEVKEAARIAHVLHFTDKLPDGLDTQVGQRGALLSGGQKQRIAIARTILKDPPIVIFDEATSALDSESERLVQEAIGIVMEGRTVLSIAHRLSTIKEADRILVLKNGKIVEDGEFDELIGKEAGAFIDLMGTQITSK